MSTDSPIVIKKRDQIKNESIQNTDPILDARFLAYTKVYICDLINAEIINNENNSEDVSNQNKRGIVKLNNTYFNKVSISGLIAGIYESTDFYRLKVDDSTGCVYVTLWKNSVFNENSLDFQASTNFDENKKYKEHFSSLYNVLNSMKERIKEERINNAIMYEPRNGDFVLIRATVRCFRSQIQLNAVSCVRLKSAADELIQMIRPSVLNRDVYNLPQINLQTYNSLKFVKAEQIEQKTFDSEVIKDKEGFLSLVNKKLIELVSRGSESDMTNESCQAYHLFTYLKNNCPTEFKMATFKQVLSALKELELRGLVYSCEDELHYLPMI